jgi:hypothetical protein
VVRRVRAVAAMRSRTALRHELQVFQKLFFLLGSNAPTFLFLPLWPMPRRNSIACYNSRFRNLSWHPFDRCLCVYLPPFLANTATDATDGDQASNYSGPASLAAWVIRILRYSDGFVAFSPSLTRISVRIRGLEVSRPESTHGSDARATQEGQ